LTRRLLYADRVAVQSASLAIARSFTATLAATLLAIGLPTPARAQAPANRDPHAAQPERPTVATHAYAVAPGWIEVEAGSQRQAEGALSNILTVPVLVKIGLGERVQLDIAPNWERDVKGGNGEAGFTDVLVGIKWRVADHAPVLNAFAVQSTLWIPASSSASGLGSGAAGLSVLLISSHQAGSVSIDANLGYTRLGGDGSVTPNNSTLWTVAAGFPVAGRLGWAAELFGFPGTTGPSGEPPVVALLTGPTLALKPSLVLDAGAIFDIAGWGGTAVYAGLTWNIGRLWRSDQNPTPSARQFASR
jgi:hypothetical protein